MDFWTNVLVEIVAQLIIIIMVSIFLFILSRGQSFKYAIGTRFGTIKEIRVPYSI